MEAVMDFLATPRTFDMEALKQPRGFLRCLQWFFAMLAFATCADFSTEIGFSISCTNESLPVTDITTTVMYPFRLDHNKPDQKPFGDKNIPCGVTEGIKEKDMEITFPGNFASDAEFFVFTGVVTWLYCFASLGIYVFYANLYSDEQKNYPKVDFLVTLLLALFWLAGSSAWGNGLSGLKSSCNPETWIYNNEKEYAAICYKAQPANTYVFTKVGDCKATHFGTFGGANVSVVVGFLNCFLWACNLWFLYKDTKWYKGGDQATATLENPDPEFD